MKMIFSLSAILCVAGYFSIAEARTTDIIYDDNNQVCNPSWTDLGTNVQGKKIFRKKIETATCKGPTYFVMVNGTKVKKCASNGEAV